MSLALADLPAVEFRVVGIDLSLTATGVATIVGREPFALGTIRSKGAKDATLIERCNRLDDLARDVLVHAKRADLVVIEQPAYNQTGGSHHDRSGLWWLVTSQLAELGIPVVEVAPQIVKKYATGKGNAGKDEVLAAVVRRYADVAVSNNNEADALVLAAIGARHSGFEIEPTIPLVNLSALAKVRWPA